MIKRCGAVILSVILGFGLVASLSGCSSEKYSPSLKASTVSAPIIGTEGVLRVGVDGNYSPFSKSTSAGIVGINVDIAAAIAEELGLKLELVDIGADSPSAGDPNVALENGSVDIVMGIDKADSSVSFWRSDAYLQSGVALFASSATTPVPTTDSGVKIAAQTSSMSAWEVNKQFGEDSLVSVNELKSAFSDLGAGTINYVAADAIIGSFAAYQIPVEASIIALLQTPNGYSVGVLDANAELKQVISDTLLTLSSNGMISLIQTKWLGKPVDLTNVPLTAVAIEESNTESEEGGEEQSEEESWLSEEEGEADTVSYETTDNIAA